MLDSAAQLSIARPSQVPSAPESRTWTTLVPSGFDLAQAVCSYGFFTQAPNSWEMQVSQSCQHSESSRADVLVRRSACLAILPNLLTPVIV